MLVLSFGRTPLLTLLIALLISTAYAQDEESGESISDPFPGVMFSDDVTILEKAPASKDDPTPFRPLRLLPTSVHVAKRTLVLTALSAMKSDTDATEVDGNKVKTNQRSYYLRLQVKQAKAHAEPENVAVVVQSFTKDLGAEGALVPIEARVDLVNIPELGGTATWMDFPALELTDTKKTKSRVSSGSAQSSSEGSAYLGIVVTVFNGTNIVFQETSLGSLKNLGVESMPGGPRKAEQEDKKKD